MLFRRVFSRLLSLLMGNKLLLYMHRI